MRLRLRIDLVEEIPDSGGTEASKHLYELRGVEGEKSDSGFSRYCTCQEGLASPWGAAEEHAFGDPSSGPFEFARLDKKVY